MTVRPPRARGCRRSLAVLAVLWAGASGGACRSEAADEGVAGDTTAATVIATVATVATSPATVDETSTCTAVTTWQRAVTDATNAYTRAGRDEGAAERRRLYLAAFDTIGALTHALVSAAGSDAPPSVTVAIDEAEAIVGEDAAEAAALPLDAFELVSVPGGSLFSASERARATVMSAAREADVLAQC